MLLGRGAGYPEVEGARPVLCRLIAPVNTEFQRLIIVSYEAVLPVSRAISSFSAAAEVDGESMVHRVRMTMLAYKRRKSLTTLLELVAIISISAVRSRVDW